MEHSGNIIVLEAEDNFKRVHKSIIENKNIDCETLGIYTRIIVLGLKWKLNIKGLSAHLDISDTRIRKSISLLEKEGYIVRTAVRGEGGKLFGWNYQVLPMPIEKDKRSSAGKPSAQKTDTRSDRQHGEPTTRLTDNTVNGEDNNNKPKEDIDLNNKNKEDTIVSKKNELDYDFIKSEWERINPNLASIRGFNDKRKRAIKNLLSSNKASVDDLIKAFTIISISSFCNGSNERGWKATFDWVINDTKSCFNRLLEGEYIKGRYEKDQYDSLMSGNDLSLQGNNGDSIKFQF